MSDDTDRCELGGCDREGYTVIEGRPNDFVVCKDHFNPAEDTLVRYADTEGDGTNE